MMKTSMFRGAAAAAVLLLAVPALAQTKTEVIHWWTSAGESAAVKVFADAFTKAGGTWVDTAIAGGANARTAGINRIVGGNPPTAMQFNTGKQFDDLVANGMLSDLEKLATATNLRKVVPPAIVGAVVRDGKVFAIPVNVHGQNWFFYNIEVLKKAGVEPPNSFDDVLAAADKLKAAGIIPLALGGQKWQERSLFNAVLLDKGGKQLFLDVYTKRDPKLTQTAGFKAAAETYGKLRAMVDAGSPGRNWNDATNLVITGKAAVQVMGDWAKGEFAAAGQVAGKDFGCNISSRDGNYVIGGDVFVFPKVKDAAAQQQQELLAKTMFEPATQIAFNIKKGSVPSRTDITDVSGMDLCAQKAVKLVADTSKQVGAVELLAPPDFNGALEDVMSEYWNKADITPAAFAEKFAKAMTQ